MSLPLRILAAAILAAWAVGAEEALQPWRMQQQMDANGQRWDIDEDGRVNSGTGSVVNEANWVNIDGDQVSFSDRRMSADGQRFRYTTELANGLGYERRVRIDPKTGVARWVEVLRNKGSTAVTAQIMLVTRLNYGWTASIAESGGSAESGLGPKDGAFAVPSQQPSRPTVAFVLGHPASKHRPVAMLNRNENYVTITFSVPVPANGVAAVVHALAQRPGALDAAGLQQLTRVCRTRDFLADLPPDIRRAVLNWGRSAGDTGGAGGGLPADLVPAPGESEVLAIGEDTRLRGTTTAEPMVVTTARGAVTVPPTRIAAIAGGAHGRIFLRDGQVLAGDLAGAIRFTLSSGLATSLAPNGLRWLVRCGLDKAPPHRLVHCADGSVLAATGAVTLPFATSWGELALPLEQVRALVAQSDGTGMVATLEDGTRLFGHLAGRITVPSEFFGEVVLEPTQVIGAGRVLAAEEEERTPTGVQFGLAGEQIVVGEPKARELRLMTPAGEVPLLIGQIRELELGDGGATVELWGGETVNGRLALRTLTVKTTGGEVAIPIADLERIAVPSPTVSSEARERIAALVRDLGHEDWQRREAASRALGELGEPARAALEEAVRASGDAEVRARADALLKALTK